MLERQIEARGSDTNLMPSGVSNQTRIRACKAYIRGGGGIGKDQKMADVAVEQLRPEVQDGPEAGLNVVAATVDLLAISGIAANIVSQTEVANNHDLNENEDISVSEILKFDEIGAKVDGSTNVGHETSEKQTGESFGTDAEVVEEEIVELEFEKVNPKLDTHSMHCPNCRAEITKVILHWKVLSYRPVVVEPTSDPKELVRCFSSLTLFIFSAISRKEVIIDQDLNKSEDTDVSEILKFDEIGANVDGSTNEGHETSEKQTGESFGTDANVVEEDIVELEFEKVKPKLDTHSMHCPNCNAEVTKVILRRKVLSYRPVDPPVVVEPPSDPKNLVGCFSCLSLFTFSDNGSFNPFDTFGKNSDTSSNFTSDLRLEASARDHSNTAFSLDD